MKAAIGLIAVVLTGSAAPGLAQQTTGELQGTVLDEGGEPIPRVEIIVSGPSLQGRRGVLSTRTGDFRILELPVGAYRVKCSHVGYQNVVLEETAVRLGRTTDLGEIRLAEALHQLPAVTVSGRKPLLDPTSTQLGANFVSADYRALPIERDYRTIAALVPQVNESFHGDELNYAGSTGHENKYFIDGVDVTDPLRGNTGMVLPYNFIRETQVRTGAYEAEYRSSLGGVVDVITYSGGNELHGQIFGYLVNHRMTASGRRVELEPKKGDFADYEVGFSVGGPLRRDTLWFYAAYDPSVYNEDVEILGHGFFPDRQTVHRFAGKLTWQPDHRNTVAFTVLGNPGDRDAVGFFLSGSEVPAGFENPDPYLLRLETSDHCLSLEARHFASDALLIDLMASRVTTSFVSQPATQRGQDEILFIDSETGIWSGGAQELSDTRHAVSTVGLSGTLVSGGHTLKSGLAYRDVRREFDDTYHKLTRISDSLFVRIDWAAAGRVAIRLPSAYVQDSWGMGRRLRVNAGLRWDGQYLVGSNGAVAQAITDQWQPRIGFTYQPGELGTQKFYGSYGRFYQELSTAIVGSIYGDITIAGTTVYDHDPRVDPSGGVFTPWTTGIQPEIDGLEGQYRDEISLGYERQVHPDTKIGARGIYRWLGQALENGTNPETGEFEFNNPGRGGLSAYPEARREYTALELSCHKTGGDRLTVLASYVLSRTYGNYTGLFGSDQGTTWPNYTRQFDYLETLENATGLLPNHRTHAFKLSGSYRVGLGLTTGIAFAWLSGTPLTEWGGTREDPPYYKPIGGRGTAGRTPAIWDLNLRFSYEMSKLSAGLQPRLVMDLLHVGSPRKAVRFDEIHYFALDEDGNQINPNPTYGQPVRYQPPMAMRLGIELDF